jgi:hypothetical protein
LAEVVKLAVGTWYMVTGTEVTDEVQPFADTVRVMVLTPGVFHEIWYGPKLLPDTIVPPLKFHA